MSIPVIVQPGRGDLLDLGNFEAIVLASGADTSNAFTLLQTQNEPTDFGPPMHIHHDAAEAFFVLEGTYLMFLEDRNEECPPGTFVYIPRGTAHTFKVVSEAPGTKLNLFTPAAMQGFLEDSLPPKQQELSCRKTWKRSLLAITCRSSARCPTPTSEPDPRAQTAP